MTITLVSLIVLLIAQEVWHDRERIAHRRERKELIERIQAGSLIAYQAVENGPGRGRTKDIDQRANEFAHEKGVTVASLKKPTQWGEW